MKDAVEAAARALEHRTYNECKPLLSVRAQREMAEAALAAAVPVLLDDLTRRIEAAKQGRVPATVRGIDDALAVVRKLRDEWSR